MKRKVQSLNSAGIEIFRAWLINPAGDPPVNLLEDARYCDDILEEYFVDVSRTFATSYELGKYLNEEVLPKVTDPVQLSAATGIWAWISLALIQNLLARSTTRKNRPLDIPHYLELDGQQGRRLGYRLIARTAWKLVRMHGERANVALGSKKSPWGEMAEQMASRQEVFAHPSFWAVAYRLYHDPSGELRRGATSQRPASARRDPKNKAGRGSVRRLPMTFRQFDRTYNTRDMSAEDMLALLPREYDKWVNGN